MSEYLYNLSIGKSPQRIVNLFICPITGDTLQNHITAELSNCVKGKFGQNSLSDADALFKVKQFITKLDHIVAKTVHDESVNTKSHLSDQLSPDHLNSWFIVFILALKFPESTHHVFYDTHCIFVKGEGQQILNSIVEVGESVFKRECLYYFLNEVSGVVIPAEFIEVKSDFHDDKRILL